MSFVSIVMMLANVKGFAAPAREWPGTTTRAGAVFPSQLNFVESFAYFKHLTCGPVRPLSSLNLEVLLCLFLIIIAKIVDRRTRSSTKCARKPKIYCARTAAPPTPRSKYPLPLLPRGARLHRTAVPSPSGAVAVVPARAV